MQRIGAIVLTVSLTLPLSHVLADTLDMPNAAVARPGAESPEVNIPSRGMSMQRVESRYGRPAEKDPAVGDPPISRWSYDDYTVYFEGKYVIHSVLDQSH